MTSTQQTPQTIPMQIHQTDDLFVLATPMPGLEPQDISVVIAGDKVTVRGNYRGSRQETGNLLVSEWTIGPYARETVLPQPVNGPLTNATYGNGVLVLAMPKLARGSSESYLEFKLDVVAATLGQRIGHTGSTLRPTTTEAHRQKIDETRQKSDRR
jgi:HSP20 family protein